jgi:hypothetical protein
VKAGYEGKRPKNAPGLPRPTAAQASDQEERGTNSVGVPNRSILLPGAARRPSTAPECHQVLSPSLAAAQSTARVRKHPSAFVRVAVPRPRGRPMSVGRH